MRYVSMLALLVLSACASRPNTTSAPAEAVPFAIVNNRPEQMTVTIGTQRERLNGLESRTVLVPISRLSEGCATVTLRTLSRDEWVSPRFCGNRKLNVTINQNLAMSQVTVAP